ncbi:hypothetical protein [Allofournierella sp.]|uniref:hypothetical protein n=1 Tax=Allofournierella sp. TaxID=1940256 RepID=UPI003AB7DC8A
MKTEFFQKLLPKGKKLNMGSLLFFAGILGLFLLLAGSFTPTKQKQGEQQAAPLVHTAAQASEEYARTLEEKLTQVVGSIQGAGEVRVAVTLEASAERVYALDEKKEGESGSREVEHILMDTEGGQDALVEMTWEPVIRGIAVVCQGADDITVNAQITEAVSVLTGVSTNRISIAKMS